MENRIFLACWIRTHEFKREGGGRIAQLFCGGLNWASGLARNYWPHNVYLCFCGGGKGECEQQFSWANCCYDQFSYKEGLFDPPATGESFTCLLNWVINCIYRVFRSNTIYMRHRCCLIIRLANLIRTHAVLGLGSHFDATPRLVLKQYLSISTCK